MVISWYGQSCFRLDTREVTLAIDPFSKELGLTPPRFQAGVALSTHAHPDHANVAAIAGNPFLITGPGEYEMRSVSIRGIPSFHDASGGRERGPNTIYRIEADGMTVAHLGDFGEPELRAETAEALGDVDILIIPVGGLSTIDGKTASAIAREIEPRVIVPMHFRLPNLRQKLSPLDDFLKAYGASRPERLDKLTIKKGGLSEGETRLVVLAAG